MMNASAQAKQQEQAFTNLAASYGASADRILAELKRISGGTIATAELVKKAGTAMMLGIAPENIIRLMEIARATSRQTGQTVSEAFSDISLGVGRQSKMILDNLGIIVQVGKANEDYAKTLNKTASQLTDVEKKQAFMNATLKGGKDLMEKMGPIVETEADRLMKYAANIENAKIALGNFLNKVLQVATGLFSYISSMITGVIGRLLDGIGSLVEWVDKLSSKIPGVDRPLKGFSNEIKGAAKNMIDLADAAFEYGTDNMKLAFTFEEVTATVNKNTAAIRAKIAKEKEEIEQKEKLKKLLEEEARLREKLYDKRLSAESDFLTAMAQNDIEIDDELLARMEQFNDEDLKLFQKHLIDKKQAEDKLLDEQKSNLEEHEDVSKNTFQGMADFYRQALSQMGDDTSSFLDMIKSKLKNLAATVASNVLTQVTMNVASFIPGISDIGKLMGMSGTGGQSSGFSPMNLLGLGKSGYSFAGGGQGFYGPNSYLAPGNTLGQPVIGLESMPAGQMGPGAPIYGGTNWLGAGAGALGVAAGGYGLYNSYKSGNVAGGALSGAGMAMGGITMAASGMLGGAAAGAVAGSVVPIIGTAIGALVGTAVGMIGKAGADAEAKRMKRAKDYADTLQAGAEADISNMTLSQYALDPNASNLLNKKNIYAMGKYGGLDDAGIMNELFRIGEIGTQYQQTIQTFGESSVGAISSMNAMQTEMKAFSGMAQGFGEDGRAIAGAWQKIADNLKELQIKAIMKDLEQGAGSFVNTLSKIDLLDLEEAEAATMKYDAALKFLTDDTLPAMSGELTKAREILKETSEEMKKAANAEKEMAIKTQLLLSDLELTESQLQGIRTGEVNTELIEMSEALGWVDREIVIVNADVEDTTSKFEALENAADSIMGSLDSLAGQLEGMDVSEDLASVYSELYKIAAVMEMVAISGQKLEELPETFEDIQKAIDETDLVAFNKGIMELADTAMYLSGTFDQLGAQKASELLMYFGQVGMAVSFLIELFLTAQSVAQNFMKDLTQNEEFAGQVTDFLDRIGDKFPKLADYWRKVWFEAAEDTKATLEDALGTGPMTFNEAANIYRGYEDQQKYGTGYESEIQRVKDQGEEAVEVLAVQMREAGFSLLEIAEVVATVRKGIQQDIEALKEAHEKAFADYMKPIQQIWQQAGMTDQEKELDNLNRQAQDWIDGLEDLDLSPEEHAAAMEDIRKSWWTLYDDIIERGREAEIEIINNFWEPLIQNIKDQIKSLQFSKFNLSAPVERAADAEAEYARLKSAMMSAKGEDFGEAYQTYKAFIDTYLTEMQNTYMSSADYVQAYQDVMDTLKLAREKAQDEQTTALSEFERGSWQRQDDTITEMQNTYRVLEDIKAQDVVNLSAYKIQQTNLAAMRDRILEDNKKATQNIEKLGIERNEILREVKGLLKDIKKNPGGGTSSGSSSQSEPIHKPLQSFG